MSLASTYASLKQKKNEKPWYTRWVFWVVVFCLGIIVMALWSMAKKQEARNKAALEIAEVRATQAKLMAKSEQDRNKAALYTAEAREAEKQAEELKVKLEASAKSRRELEAAIKGATSMDELDKLEEEVG